MGQIHRDIETGSNYRRFRWWWVSGFQILGCYAGDSVCGTPQPVASELVRHPQALGDAAQSPLLQATGPRRCFPEVLFFPIATISDRAGSSSHVIQFSQFSCPALAVYQTSPSRSKT